MRNRNIDFRNFISFAGIIKLHLTERKKMKKEFSKSIHSNKGGFMLLKKAAVLLFLALFMSFSVHATTMYELSLQNLSTGSEMVVQAKVTAIVKQWDKDSSVIFTYIRMNIIDDLIGDDEDNEIIIKQPGGTIGYTTLHVEGTSTYKVGEENMLFLFTDPVNLSAFQTLGMYQGKYMIYDDGTGTKRVRQDNASDVRLISKNNNQAVETGDDLTLDEFKIKVLEYINAKKDK